MLACPGLRRASPGEAVSIEHVRSAEINGVALGVPLVLLMENAGRAVADAVECRLGGVEGRVVHVLAGKGGNAGDGFVAARHLARRGARVVVHLSSSPSEVSHPDARLNLEALLSLDSVRIVKPWGRGWLDLSGADAVIDAMLGIGVRGALRGAIREMAEAFNRSRGLRVAVDTPTGLDPDTGVAVEGAVRADLTVAMGWAKRGFFVGEASLYTGEVLVAEIGLPREAELYAGPGDVLARLPRRPRDAHKGVGGRVLVVAGGENYVGAAVLAAMAACRSGVDLVYLASEPPTAKTAASQCSSIIPVPLRGRSLSAQDVPRLVMLAKRAHATLIGPGIGSEDSVLEAAAGLIGKIAAEMPGHPLVVDADGLKALELHKPPLPTPTVLTPHRGEARRLAGKDGSPEELAREIASSTGATVLVKAPVDAACSPRGVCRLNRSGVAAMSVGGTGDVLAGLLAGYLARRASKGLDPDPLNVAITAAYVAGRAGELAYGELGEAMTALDVLGKVPLVYREAAELARSGQP